MQIARRWAARGVALVCAIAASRLVAPWWCGRDARAWLDGDRDRAGALAAEMIGFEARDDRARAAAVHAKSDDRFAGEWALVTHQMTALGLAQIALAHRDERERLAPEITRAALKCLLPEMRDFGTRAWNGEDALASEGGAHGHAYLGYAALAIGVARSIDPAFPAGAAKAHDALVAAYARRLLASPTGLVETYPGEAYPTDTAAVAAAIAAHGRATGVDHGAVLARWVSLVRARQVDPASGLLVQRMGAADGKAHDVPRASGTALAAYLAGFVDRQLARDLGDAALRREADVWGFGGVREYADGQSGAGDVDSGPVVLGVSVSATGFALATARAFGRRDAFERLYRTTDLFGAPSTSGDRLQFASGGPIGNALLLAMLTSGPEVVPP